MCDILKKNQSFVFEYTIDFKLIDSYISDYEYSQLLKKSGAGGYFNNSIILYPLGSLCEGYSFQKINNLINQKYNSSKHLLCFGCDLFGNQIFFDEDKVSLFDIETSEITHLADNFAHFCKLLYDDDFFNFLSGENLLSEWLLTNVNLPISDRFCPKIPFILNGEYSLGNIINKNFYDVINFSHSIYNQIKDLPDGTSFKIKVE